MASTIGIKIANGEFYSIVDENSQVKKRLVLTTVHDRQLSAQIDLYKSYSRSMVDAIYIGSLVLENIKPMPKGEPSIELVITSTRNGEITAEAVDMDSSARGEPQTLTISLESLDEDSRNFEMPDFDLENDQAATRVRSLHDDDYEEDDEEETGKSKFPWLLVILAALVLTAIGLAIWIFFFQGGNGLDAAANRNRQLAREAEVRITEPAQTPPAAAQPPAQAPAAAPPAQAQPAPAGLPSPVPPPIPAAQAPAAAPPAQAQPAATGLPTPTPPPVMPAPGTQSAQAAPANPALPPVTPPPAAQPLPVIQAPLTPAVQSPVPGQESPAAVSRARSSAPVASFAVPAVIPREGVLYTVRFGDTLWDIADAFYRDPMLYPRIARFNNIANPDLIITGSVIRVPPRN